MGKTVPRRIGAIEVGFRIVRVLETSGALGLSELAIRAGMSPSKAYGYVTSFVREGLVQQDLATRRYRLGAYAVSLGTAAIDQSRLFEITPNESFALSEATTCSVMLNAWGNRGPAIVHCVYGKHRAPDIFRIGRVLPLWGSATGRVFLAHLPEDVTAGLLDPDLGLIDRGAREAELARIRSDGFAVTDEAAAYGGIAAPIFDDAQRVLAVLTLGRPYDDNSLAHRRELGAVLRRSALSISQHVMRAAYERRSTSTRNGATALRKARGS